MQALTSVSVKLFSRYDSSNEIPLLLSSFMVSYCPNLTHLEFSVEILGNICVPQLIQRGSWKNLRVLTLRGRAFYEPEVDDGIKAYLMSNFLARHSQIQCLCFDGPDLILPNCIPPGSLPRLISLSISGLRRTVSLDSVLEPLRYTVIPRMRHITWEFSNCDLYLLREMTSLQSCNATISGSTDVQARELIRSLPICVERFNLVSWLHWSVEEVSYIIDVPLNAD